MGKSESGYSGPDRRTGNDLSSGRALEIMNALEAAQAELKAKRDSIQARFLRWLADIVGTGYKDIDVSCEFRGSDSAAKIRELFIDSSMLNEAAVLAGGWEDSEEEIRDEFIEARAEVLADFAEIMIRSGIASWIRDVEQNEDIVFGEGHIYRIEIHGKKVLATCNGFTEQEKHFYEGRSFPSGEPVFQFYRGKKFDSYGRYVGGYKIGKVYILQEPRYDVHMEFCGYTRYGDPVMKFLRRELIVGVADECQAGLNS